MNADESRPAIRRPRPVERVELPAGPQRDLRDAIYLLYGQADRPQLEELAKSIAADDDLPGAPKKDLVSKVISGAVLASLQDTLAVAVALARAAGRRDIAAVADNVRRLWGAAKVRRKSAIGGSPPPMAVPVGVSRSHGIGSGVSRNLERDSLTPASTSGSCECPGGV